MENPDSGEEWRCYILTVSKVTARAHTHTHTDTQGPLTTQNVLTLLEEYGFGCSP